MDVCTLIKCNEVFRSYISNDRYDLEPNSRPNSRTTFELKEIISFNLDHFAELKVEEYFAAVGTKITFLNSHSSLQGSFATAALVASLA